ncbi:metal-binding protein, partial [Mesorhizobium sp. M2A.F.Ca.ET.040.01.1.1]
MDRNGSFPANIADISSEPDASDGVTVIVCSSCRDETGSDAHPRAGALLAEGTRRAA